MGIRLPMSPPWHWSLILIKPSTFTFIFQQLTCPCIELREGNPGPLFFVLQGSTPPPLGACHDVHVRIHFGYELSVAQVQAVLVVLVSIVYAMSMVFICHQFQCWCRRWHLKWISD